MNVALIIAGGSGQRMHLDIPKQFVNVNDKPIIIYTLEQFENHPDIDKILVVCLDGWHEILKAYAKQYSISKLAWVVSGGKTGHQSINNGIDFLADICSDDDIVMIHDAIRPLISSEIISDCIVKCKLFGNGVSAIPCVDTMLMTEDKIKSNISISRDKIMRVQTPQAYRFGLIHQAYQTAKEKGITDCVYANTLLIELGETLYFAVGSEKI